MSDIGQNSESLSGWLVNGEHIRGLTRDQMRHTSAVVIDRFGDSDASRDIIAAICHPPRTTRRNYGAVPPSQRTEWLQRCRAWVREQGYVLAGTNVPKEHQQAYVEATGDVYDGPSTGPRKQGAKGGYGASGTRGEAQKARRQRERGESAPSLAADAFDLAQAERRAKSA